MAPKSGEKKPAQPAKKAVAKKSSAGRKKGSKKAVESYKIYIYKVSVRRARRKPQAHMILPTSAELKSQMFRRS